VRVALVRRSFSAINWQDRSLNPHPIVHVAVEDHDMPADIVPALCRHGLALPKQDPYALPSAALRESAAQAVLQIGDQAVR